MNSAAKELVAVPAQYTFKRPLGQFDNCQTLPESCKIVTETTGDV